MSAGINEMELIYDYFVDDIDRIRRTSKLYIDKGSFMSSVLRHRKAKDARVIDFKYKTLVARGYIVRDGNLELVNLHALRNDHEIGFEVCKLLDIEVPIETDAPRVCGSVREIPKGATQ